MRIPAIFALALVSSLALGDRVVAQGGAQPPKTFASAADVEAMINKAKSERKPDQANFIQPLLRVAPYTANLGLALQLALVPNPVRRPDESRD